MTGNAAIALLVFVTLQRFHEFLLDRYNTRRLLAAGAVEYGRSHYWLFIVVHASWLAGLWILGHGRAMIPAYLIPFALLTMGRYWVLGTLGWHWSTRVLIVPGAPLVSGGPYRFLKHPNYVVVAGELTVVPLALGLPTLAALYLALYAAVLIVRLRTENAALAGAEEGEARCVQH